MDRKRSSFLGRREIKMKMDTHGVSVEEATESLLFSTVQKCGKRGHLLRLRDRNLGSGFKRV